MLGFRNRVFSLMCVLFASCASFPTAHANEGTLNRSSNPDALKMILQEIQSLRKELEVLQKQVERLSDAVAESKKNPDGNAKPRPVITQKARPLKEFSIGSIHPDDVKNQSLTPIESPLSSKRKAPKNMGEALEAIGHHIIEEIESGAKSAKPLSGTHFKIANTEKGYYFGGPAFVTITILNVGDEIGYNVRCHVLVKKHNIIIDEGGDLFNNGKGIAPGQYSKRTIDLPRTARTQDYDKLEFRMFWDKSAEAEVQVDQQPRLIRKTEPKYPVDARRAQMEGIVSVEFTVGITGRATNIKVPKSIGFGFDEASIEAVKKWRFAPAIKKGVRIPVRVKVPIEFSLKG